jgi:hypothetical protein
MTALRVLLAGHDWGGLNLLTPLMRAWHSDERLSWAFLGAPLVRREMRDLVPGVRFVDGVGDLTDWLLHRRDELDEFLDRTIATGHYDIILCSTSAHCSLERRLLVAGRRAGIATIAFCDMSWAYEERFLDGNAWALPDRLWVVDEAMKQSAGAINWPSPLRIDVIGSPLFADLMHRRTARESEGRAIRFISEPASTKFPDANIDEFLMAELVVRTANAVRPGTPVVVRPHPTDSAETWRRWCFARRELGVEFDTLPIEEAIADTAFAVGITSMLLAQMRICGARVASFQPADASQEYYCLPFEDLGITRIPNANKLAQWLTDASPVVVAPMATVHVDAIERATSQLLHLARQGDDSCA